MAGTPLRRKVVFVNPRSLRYKRAPCYAAVPSPKDMNTDNGIRLLSDP